MMYVPFCNDVGYVMYTLICTRHDLSHPISILSILMVNLVDLTWNL